MNEPAIFKLVEKVGVEIVGAVASTTLPVPVDVVAPVPPLATGNVPATAEVRLMLVKVFSAPDIVLPVMVPVLVRLTKTSAEAGLGNVSVRLSVLDVANMRVFSGNVPERLNLRNLVESKALTKAVVESNKVLLVSVSVVALPTSVSVEVGRVSVPVLDMVEIIGAVSVLLVSV